MTYRFEQLDIWPVSRALVKEVYRISEYIPKHELFGLTNQMRRAAVSVPSNVVEGSSKHSPKEQIKFYETSYASLMECFSQLILAVDLGYIHNYQIEKIKPLIDRVAAMLSGLRKSAQSRLETK